MSKGLIVKSNDIITASYRLTANEHRLILCAISKIPPGTPIKSNTLYFVDAYDFMEMGIDPSNAGTYLQEAASRIYERELAFDVKGFGKNRIRWLSQRAEIFDGKAYVNKFPTEEERQLAKQHLMDWFKVEEILGNWVSDRISVGIRFGEPLIPYLANVQENFTKYLKEEIGGFSSAYSIRIYELLMQFRNTKFRVFTISQLKEILEITDKYPLFTDFKKRVIDIAVSEINEKSPYNVTATYKKSGRKYTTVQFHFDLKKGVKLDYINESNDQALTVKNINSSHRDPNTLDMFNLKTDAELSENQQELIRKRVNTWRSRGLTDKQIGKLSYYMREFVDKNKDKLHPTDRRGYEEIFDAWKPLLKDPKAVNDFNAIQDILDYTKK